MTTFLRVLRNRFLAGVLVTVPVIATFLILRWLFQVLDGFLGPWIEARLGRNLPGVGLAALLVLLFAVGLLSANLIGRRLVGAWESLVQRFPLVRSIHGAARDVVASLARPAGESLRDPVLVPYPHPGLYAYGFVTGITTLAGPAGPRRMANVFIPSPPVPTTGMLVAVPVEELVYLDLEREAAMRLIISAGIAVPETLGTRPGGSGGAAGELPES
jgi:uncharacterized membrane protein